MTDIHTLIKFVSTVVILSMMVVLAGLSVDKSRGWWRLRLTRACMVGATAILGFFGILTLVLANGYINWSALMSGTLVVASFQALLFTYICIWFVRPRYRSSIGIGIQTIAITLIGGGIIYTAIDNPALYTVCRFTGCALYAIQMTIYTAMFIKQYRLGAEYVDEEYQDYVSYRLRWVRVCFFSALLVGVLALCFALFELSQTLYDVFVAGYTIYYVYLSICLLNYRTNAEFLIKVNADQDTDNTPTNAVADTAETEDVISDTVTIAIGEALRRWVSEERYLVPDTTMDEIVAYFGVTRRQLSTYFAEVMHMQFRTWRNILRIDHAKQVLENESDITASQLAARSGFPNASNFYNEFRKQTGMTPGEYRLHHKS